MFVVLGENARGRESLDGIFPQVDQADIVAVVCLEVTVVQNEALGSEMVVGKKFSAVTGS